MRKEYIMKRLMELAFKDKLDVVDQEEERRLMKELEEIEANE